MSRLHKLIKRVTHSTPINYSVSVAGLKDNQFLFQLHVADFCSNIGAQSPLLSVHCMRKCDDRTIDYSDLTDDFDLSRPAFGVL